MKFGVREIANVVFRAKTAVKIGNTEFQAKQPVLYIDTAKTSTLEGAATTVYATGGRGNSRLIAWEGEKTLTFTVEDALLSPIGFSILSGAGLIKGESKEKVNAHVTTNVLVDTNGVIDLTDALGANEELCLNAPLFILEAEEDGSANGKVIPAKSVDIVTKEEGEDPHKVTTKTATGKITVDEKYVGQTVIVDYYVARNADSISEIQIDAENFAGYYYVEADTLFRRQDTGVDMPAILTLPNVKIQSNFTFTMASSGDPSTFTFTMDAFPGYTYFDQTKKVLCVIQVLEDNEAAKVQCDTVMAH